MSTRKLIVVALLCGLAILIAGGIQLFRIMGAEEAEIYVVGDRIVVSGIDVTVTAAEIDDERITIAVTMVVPSEVPALDDVAGAWSVSTGDDRNAPAEFAEPPQPRPCPSAPLESGSELMCSLAFERGRGSPFARFTAMGNTGVWELDAA